MPQCMKALSVLAMSSLFAVAAPSGPAPKQPSFELRTEVMTAQHAQRNGDVVAALSSIQKALGLAEKEGNDLIRGECLRWRSEIEQRKGNIAQAISDLKSAAATFTAGKAMGRAVITLHDKSTLEENSGDPAAAEISLLDAEKLAVREGLIDEQTLVACGLVRHYIVFRKLELAKSALERAESLKPTTEHLKASVLMARARFSGAKDEVDVAEKAYRQAQAKLVSIGELHEAANAYFNLAAILGRAGRYADAEIQFDGAVTNFTRSSSLGGLGMTLSLRAWHLIQQGKLDTAEPILQMADSALRAENYVTRLADNEFWTAHFWSKRKSPGKAHDSAERAASIFEKMGQLDRAAEVRKAFPKPE